MEQGDHSSRIKSATCVNLLVSYAWDDRQQNVRAMVKFLQTVAKFRVSVDSDRIATGAPIEGDIRAIPTQTIDAADVVILFCNRNFQSSPHCRRVVAYAYKQLKVMLPVLLEPDMMFEEWLARMLGFLPTNSSQMRSSVAFASGACFEVVADDLIQQLAKRCANKKNYLPTKIDESLIAIAEQETSVKRDQAETENATIPSKPATPPVVITDEDRDEERPVPILRQARIVVSHPVLNSRQQDIDAIVKHLRSMSFLVFTSDDINDSDCLAKVDPDLVIAFADEPEHDVTSLRNLSRRFILITLSENRNQRLSSTVSPRSQAQFCLGRRPVADMINELLDNMAVLLTQKSNIPRVANYHKRAMEEESVQNAMKKLCSNDAKNQFTYLAVNGESGVGKTTLVSSVLSQTANKRLLAFDCRVQNVVWLNVSQFCHQGPRESTKSSLVNHHEKWLFESLAEAMENGSSTTGIHPKTRFNLASLFGSERRNHGWWLIVVDNYLNNNNNAWILESLAKLGSRVRLVVITSADPTAATPLALVSQNGKALVQSSVTVNAMPQFELQKMLAQSLDWQLGVSEIANLAKLCLGLPIIAKLVDGHLTRRLNENPNGSVMEAVMHCDALERILAAEQQANQQRLRAVYQTIYKLFQLNFERLMEPSGSNNQNQRGKGKEPVKIDQHALQTFSWFLCFAPGEPVHIEDLAVMMNCEATTADRVCTLFVRHGLLVPAHQQSGVVTSYAVDEVLYYAAVEFAAKERRLFMSQSDLLGRIASGKAMHSVVVKHRKHLLRKMIAEMDVKSLEKICRFSFSFSVDETAPHLTFIQLLLQEQRHWREQGVNIAARLLMALLIKLETKFDLFQLLTLDNDGECALLDILELSRMTTDRSAEMAAVQRKVQALLDASTTRQLEKEAIIEKRRWQAEAKDQRNDRLFAAVVRNDDAVVHQIVTSHPRRFDVIDRKNHNGETPLMAASALNRIKTAELLLASGADVNARSNDGMTPLHFAAKNGHVAIVELILGISVDGPHVNATELRYGGMTALMMAARAGHADVVSLLKRHPVIDIHARTATNGSTALMMAAQKGHLKIINELAVIGADASAANKDGMTPLMLAAQNGHLEVVKVVNILAPASLDASRPDGLTALMLAAQAGHDAVVAYLKMNGASVTTTAPGCFNRNALMLASLNGHRRVVETLRTFGGADDVDAKDSSPSQATALLMAAELGHGSVVQLLVTLGADVNCMDAKTGHSVLATAAANGHWEIVEFLKVHGADINATAALSGKTALMLAAERGYEECVYRLVRHGADVSIKCRGNNWTALTYAVNNGHASIARFLLDAGADSNVLDGDYEAKLWLSSGTNLMTSASPVLLRFSRQSSMLLEAPSPRVTPRKVINASPATSSRKASGLKENKPAKQVTISLVINEQ